MDGDFRTSFVREPASLRHFPALVLNADYRPLSYYPLSLWPWQEAVKAVFLDRVSIVAEYDQTVRSQRAQFRIPSVVVLKEFVRPQKRVAFTRFNLFLRDEFCCQYCGSRGDLTFDHVVPRSRGGSRAGKTWWPPAPPAICARATSPSGRRECALPARRSRPLRMRCTITVVVFRRTIFTRRGWTFYTGMPNWTHKTSGAPATRT